MNFLSEKENTRIIEKFKVELENILDILTDFFTSSNSSNQRKLNRKSQLKIEYIIERLNLFQ